MDTYLSLFLFHLQSTWDKNWTIWCRYVWQENSCLYSFKVTIIWLMSHFLTSENRPEFRWNIDTYGGRSRFISYICAFVFYVVSLTSMTAEHNHRFNQKDSFFCFITFKSIYIKSVHSGPKFKAIISHYWCDVLDYISPLLVCGDCPLTSKTGGCWNLLE